MAIYHEDALEIIKENCLHDLGKEYKNFAINIKLYEFTHTFSSILFESRGSETFIDFGGSKVTFSDMLDMLSNYEGDESPYTMSSENLLKSFISVFEDYLKEILEYLFNSYPHHIFKRKATLPMTKLLEYDSLELLKDSLIKEKVISLSFNNLVEVIGFIEDEFKVDMEIDIEVLESLTELTLIRNILVHNKGIVNEMFLRKIKGHHHLLEKPYELGTKIIVSPPEMNDLFELLLDLGENIYGKLNNKYGKAR